MQARGEVNYMVSSKDSDKGPWAGIHQGCVWMAVLIVLVSLATTGAVSAATPITGPVVITVPGDYYLANNIIDSAVGIIIAVPNVVLDGKGKTLDGVDGTSSVGIRIYNAGMTLYNVVVKNVVLTDWGNGVFLTDVKNSQLEKVTASSNTGSGILAQNSIRNTIKTCTVTDNGIVGILLYENSDSNTLTGNTATANALEGMRIRYSSNNDILNNKVLDNKNAGINLEGGRFNTVTGNTITGNKGDGIRVYESSGNTITKNTLKYNVGGITLNPDSFNNEISQNTVQNSTYNGILLMNNANNNMVMGNTFDKNGNSGIRIVRSGENTVTGNYVRNNLQEGLYMWDTGTVSNVVVNNYFYNEKNNGVYTPVGSNRFNLPQSAQKSITGGANSGGNSWGQPNGQGFSQITPATNGICDKPYSLATNNVDNLPLKWASK